jgi:hypothetical protein
MDLQISYAATIVIHTENANLPALAAEHRKLIGAEPGVLTRAFRLHTSGVLVFCTDHGVSQTIVVTGPQYKANGQDEVVKARSAEWDRQGATH